MTSEKVRADYVQLAAIAQSFGQQAESARSLLGALRSDMATLQAGDWVGRGADKFYAEMNASVLPAMTRMVAAMNEAARTTARISQVMKQAEGDSAALFRLDGADGSTAGAVPGPDSSLVSGFVGGKADAGGPSGGSGAGRSRTPVGSGGPAPAELSPQVKKMLAGLDPGVADLVKASPEMRMELEQLAKAGVTFTRKYPPAKNEIDISGPDAKAQFEDIAESIVYRKAKERSADFVRETEAKVKQLSLKVGGLADPLSDLKKLRGKPGYEARKAEVFKAHEKLQAELAREIAGAKGRENHDDGRLLFFFAENAKNISRIDLGVLTIRSTGRRS
jgi:WXG100 family type VII secretion target